MSEVLGFVCRCGGGRVLVLGTFGENVVVVVAVLRGLRLGGCGCAPEPWKPILMGAASAPGNGERLGVVVGWGEVKCDCRLWWQRESCVDWGVEGAAAVLGNHLINARFDGGYCNAR